MWCTNIFYFLNNGSEYLVLLKIMACCSLCFVQQRKTFSKKRGPPGLQKDGNASIPIGGEKHEQDVIQDEAGEDEDKGDKEKTIVR